METDRRRVKTRTRLALAGFLALSLSAGLVGSVASSGASEFYSTLIRPSWAPPGWLFGPVWLTLYLSMGWAAWLVWREVPTTIGQARSRTSGLRLFAVQLILNAAWTWLFFALRQGALAFAEILLLAVAVGLMLRKFARVRPLAGWLLVPYLAWISFAAALTWAVWQANTGRL